MHEDVAHQPVERHVAAVDMCQGTDLVRDCRLADLLAAGDQADAEGRVIAHAGRCHVEIARLENLERQNASGKEHCAQGKERNLETDGCGRNGRLLRLLTLQKVQPSQAPPPSGFSPQRCMSACGRFN